MNESSLLPRYHKTDTVVAMGDRVLYRSIYTLFFKKNGRIAYVPGVSSRHQNMEFGGLQNVGVKLNNGTCIGTLVDPSTGFISSGITFLHRDDSALATPRSDWGEESNDKETGCEKQ